jgi:hypothetical protein
MLQRVGEIRRALADSPFEIGLGPFELETARLRETGSVMEF